jgi:hypothetical protein
MNLLEKYIIANVPDGEKKLMDIINASTPA